MQVNNQKKLKRIIEKRFTQNAQTSLAKIIARNKNKDFKKIVANELIGNIEKQKGCLGSFIIKNLHLGKNFQSQKQKNIYLFEIILGAFQLACNSKNFYVGTDHLVFSYLKILAQKNKKITLGQKKYGSADDWSGFNDNSFRNNSSRSDFLGEINSLIGDFLFTGQKTNGYSKILQQFCVNLNQLAENQRHILIGRKKELERISNTLGRKMKNNPVLIGEPGVGKTAIVEGLAQKINEGKAPFYLNNKKIFTLDLGLLVAGTNFRGEFENRLKEVVNEVKKNRNIILFIDEIHNLIGAGAAIGGMDAANLLKPALSRGEIQIIGATTFEEYHKHIEKDAALERRLQPITVNEPSRKECLEILKGIKPSYEKYHQVAIGLSALENAVILAKRYITNRFMPDSAIDLIDETSARIRSTSQKHYLFDQLQTKKNELEETTAHKENLVISNQYEEAINFRNLENKLKEEIKIIKEKINQKNNALPIKITGRDIQETLANALGLPIDLLLKEKKSIPLKIKKILNENVFGQKNIIDSIYKTLVCQFSYLANNQKPLGSFLFLGHSGIGKTLTAKLISQIISPAQKDNLIQINMSEFMEKHTVSRLLGAPAGYIGYEEGGEFLDRIRKNPYSVVLFDEIEKADQQVLNILLQILDEGKISNAKGQMINFKNTIIILTSNVGVDRLSKITQLGFETNSAKIEEELKNTQEEIREDLKEILSVELLNRLDNILFFNHLDKKTISKIVEKNLNEIKNKLKKQKIELEIEEKVIEKIAKKSLDFQQGARLVNQKIKQEIEPLIAEYLLSGKKNFSKISLKIKKGKIVIE